jgi:hypothetical protein
LLHERVVPLHRGINKSLSALGNVVAALTAAEMSSSSGTEVRLYKYKLDPFNP